MRSLVAAESGGHVDAHLDRERFADPRDRGLALHLAYGVLRRRGAIDRVLQSVASRPIAEIDPIAASCMRVGLFEASESRTAVHAAVDQAVTIARVLGLGRASGFVNAVLRKAVHHELPDDPLLDLPPWLQDRWRAWPDWVRRLREPSPIAVVVRAEGEAPPFEARPAEAGGARVADTFWVDGTVKSLPGFDEGTFWVMDPAAAAVAWLAFRAARGEHPRILDACAAPGGKTALFASRGARVVAVDASAARLARLRENMSRLRLDVDVRQHDWTKGPLPAEGASEQFDVVLVDAPCTSLGTVRRHPEVRWRVLPSDPLAMSVLQEGILSSVIPHVRPGGALVYAVCSPLEEEGERVVERLRDWSIDASFRTVPPSGGEDAHQAFVLRMKDS